MWQTPHHCWAACICCAPVPTPPIPSHPLSAHPKCISRLATPASPCLPRDDTRSNSPHRALWTPSSLLHALGTRAAAVHGVASARPIRLTRRLVAMSRLSLFRDPPGSVEEERSEPFTRDRMQPGEPAYQRPTTQTPLSTARPLASPTTPSAHHQHFPHHSPHHQHRPPTSPTGQDQLPPLSTALYTAPKSSYYDPTSDHGVGQPHGSTAARYESHYPSQVRIAAASPSSLTLAPVQNTHPHTCAGVRS